MRIMKLKFLALCLLPYALAAVTPAAANWQFPGEYASGGGGSFTDNGGRFTMAVRGGVNMIVSGGIGNDLGTSLLDTEYWKLGDLITASCGDVASCLAQGYTSIGTANASQMRGKTGLGGYSWASSVAIGWVVPNYPQWRLELNWDHIGQTEYNATPMFSGIVNTTGGASLDMMSGSVHSTVDTDIISAMFYYDFFDGVAKPTGEFIPYIGFGVGYADSRTVLNMTDLYGDMFSQPGLLPFVENPSADPWTFYTSKTNSGSIAGALALGFSYGIADGVFLDLGLKLTYVPQIKWALNNEMDANATSKRGLDVFSAKNIIYGTALLGVRMEF